jgi:MFS family permease
VKWRPLLVLAAAQFLMVLDQAVMNVSISQLVEDFDTSVTVIQGVITFYALTMAALMITGGKLGDRWGRKRAFLIGLAIYATGSALTAVAPTVPVLLLGWSILEGVGAALVLPALVAMVAGIYEGSDRAIAYGILGGVAGAGVAVGPILGGWVTTSFTWRYVFVGEVVLTIVIVITSRLLGTESAEVDRPELDWTGAVISALALALIVFGVLQASEWGWLADASSPVSPFGLALTPFVVGAGFVGVGGFVIWTERRTRRGRSALFRLGLFRILPVRSGLQMLFMQNLMLMGVFFAIPLYLQVVQGLDALETGVRLLPVSLMMFVTSFAGARLAKRWTPRQIVRAALWALLLSVLVLMATIRPELGGVMFAIATALLGSGIGLMASQLGNVIQSAVGDSDRSEIGGLQFTAQQLGSAMGTALVGAMVITALGAAFTGRIANDQRVPADFPEFIEVELAGSIPFVPTDTAADALEDTGLAASEVTAIIESYEESQLVALRIGLLVVAALVVFALFTARRLPDQRFDEMAAPDTPPSRANP